MANKRELKGTSIKQHVDNYSVVDLETTDVNILTASIIEISALKVRNNKVVGEFSTLVNPHVHIPIYVSRLNHITDDMVADAPGINDVYEEFLDFVGNDIILGYNNASFDMNILYDAGIKLKGVPFANDYIDLRYPAKRCFPHFEYCSLETVSRYYGLNTSGEHRALKDCYLTKLCFDKLSEEYGDTMFFKSEEPSRKVYPLKTVAYSDLVNYVLSVPKNENLEGVHILYFKKWIKEHKSLRKATPFHFVFSIVDDVIRSEVVTSENAEQLYDLFLEYMDPLRCLRIYESIKSLYGKHIGLDGKFDDRKQVETLIESAGGVVNNWISRRNDYVVIGEKSIEDWTESCWRTRSGVSELLRHGRSIGILYESDFIPMAEKCANKQKKRTVKEFYVPGWFFYGYPKAKTIDDASVGKWMSFFTNQQFAKDICVKAIQEGACSICKCRDISIKNPMYEDSAEAPICFYIDGNDKEQHKRILLFMLKNNLIQRNRYGDLCDIGFKFDQQTIDGEYGENFKARIKLSDYVDLWTERLFDF